MSSFSKCNQRFGRAHKERIVLGLEQTPLIGIPIREDQAENQKLVLKLLIAIRTWQWEGHQLINQTQFKSNKSFKEFPTTKVIRINCNNSRTSFRWLILIHTSNNRPIRFNNSNSLSIRLLLFKSHPSINIASYFSKMLLSLTRVWNRSKIS